MRKVGEKVRLRTDLKTGERYKMFGSNYGIIVSEVIVNFLQGKELTISSGTSLGYFCDETGGNLIFTDEMFEAPPETLSISIHRKGRKVIAEDLETGRIGVAVCNPADEFNPEYGVIIAIHRMFGRDSSLIIVKEGEEDGDTENNR